ncbi:MAG: sodium-dependent bicarbonate transport family permease [Myxococcota bacterium]
MGLDLALATILSPVVLFFVLGLVAALARSDMAIPEAFAKGIAIYLMMAIGIKGGVEMSKSGLTPQVLAVIGAGILLSFVLPLVAFVFLRATTQLGRIDAAATAAHYGSISIVTFVAATQAVSLSGLESSGYLVAIAALMETPAIVSALLLVGRDRTRSEDEPGGGPRELLREVLLNASVVTLVGALLIGWITGTEGMADVKAFFVTPLKGVLCLFLLDMGLAAGRGLRRGYKMLGLKTVAFGLYMPLVSAVIAGAFCMVLPVSTGDAALFITLGASSSYIAVPAAMRLALPEAKPYIYLTLSLGITFPFNLTVGIPLYILIAQWVTG